MVSRDTMAPARNFQFTGNAHDNSSVYKNMTRAVFLGGQVRSSLSRPLFSSRLRHIHNPEKQTQTPRLHVSYLLSLFCQFISSRFDRFLPLSSQIWKILPSLW